MTHRHTAGAVNLRLAADVGRNGQRRLAALQCIEPVVAQPLRKLGLRDRIRARLSAAQMAVGDMRQIEAKPQQARLDPRPLASAHAAAYMGSERRCAAFAMLMPSRSSTRA
jgi:hypothetical protein